MYFFTFRQDTKSLKELNKLSKTMLASHSEKLKHYGIYIASPASQYDTPSGLSYVNFTFLSIVTDFRFFDKINQIFKKTKYF